MFQEVEFSLVSVCPLLCHNGQTADPLNPYAKKMKALTSVRKKTDENYAELARIEWEAGLYLDDKGQPTLPPHFVEAAVISGAKKSKLGTQFKSGFFIDRVTFHFPEKNKSLDELYELCRDSRTVRVNSSRVVRTRPIFRSWELTGVAQVDTDTVDVTHIEKALRDAGRLCGMGDYRPQFGRFDVVSVALLSEKPKEKKCQLVS